MIRFPNIYYQQKILIQIFQKMASLELSQVLLVQTQREKNARFLRPEQDSDKKNQNSKKLKQFWRPKPCNSEMLEVSLIFRNLC